jgi:hypothetical protein
MRPTTMRAGNGPRRSRAMIEATYQEGVSR